MSGSYRSRHAEQLVLDALSDTRVVAVNGARQAGKSTLVRRLIAGRDDAREYRLDRGTDRAAAGADPDAFVRGAALTLIDEVQRVPDLMLAIKAVVDEDRRPGQFLLTGSARLLGLRKLPDALVGRMETVELWPFSQGEIDGAPDRFLDALFDDRPQPQTTDAMGRDALGRDEYLRRVVRGGFPEAVAREASRRERFFENYLNDLVDRDVTQLADIERRHQLRELIVALARRAAQPLSVERIASEVGIPARTLSRYLSLLEEVFLIKRIPAWGSGRGRSLSMDKLLFVDSGLAADVLGLNERRLAHSADLVGPMVENFVLAELARQCTWNHERCRLSHFRTKDGVEVDAIIESRDGRLLGVEVKAATTVRESDFAGIKHLATRYPDRFHAGVVLHTGPTAVPFGDRLWALPISSLWNLEPEVREVTQPEP
jgi:uncharacterized protein